MSRCQGSLESSLRRQSTGLVEAPNYKSADEMSQDLEKFREDAGLMFPSTVGALKQLNPGRPILIAPMGAIRKPNGDVRPLHDGTHGVQVNNAIEIKDQLQYPGPADAAAVVMSAEEAMEASFGLSADIASAHRLVKIRKKDWTLVCCKTHTSSPVVWVNKVGTFGISSAPYWWTRLFACVGRTVGRILLKEVIYQLVYVDDLHVNVAGSRKFLNLWIALAAYEVLGTPFSYKKFKGGLQVQFVGFELDYAAHTIGITARRSAWIVEFIGSLEDAKYMVAMRSFAEFLGRLGFVARVLTWLKPHLGPLYAWVAALDKGCVAAIPKMVRLVLLFVRSQLALHTRHLTCRRPLVLEQEQFRTDAKCERDRVVLGGHQLGSSRWFSLELTPRDTPFLFNSDGESSWASAPAELLAALAALVAFGYLEDTGERRLMPIALSAGTDNRSNEFLMKRHATTKWPLVLINMELSKRLMQAQLSLQLAWRPRDENVLADSLTNQDFSAFDSSLRVDITWAGLQCNLLEALWDSRHDYLDRSSQRFYFGKLGKHEKSEW